MITHPISTRTISLLFAMLIALPLGWMQQSKAIFPEPSTSTLSSITNSTLTPQVLPEASHHIPSYCLSSALISFGYATHFSPSLNPLNLTTRDHVQSFRQNSFLHGAPFHIDNYLQFAPFAAPLVLKASGLNSPYDWHNLILLEAFSAISMLAMSESIKHFSGVKRPDSWALNSFPSGHTAFAFMGAELCRIEFPDHPVVGITAYAVAATVGFLRIYNNRHWLGDVAGGIGVGILSVRLAQGLNNLYNHYLVPHPLPTTYQGTIL